jgi:hypothetical protein
MADQSKAFEKALEIGRPPNIIKLFQLKGPYC